ncbi:hypothetical protein TrST_g10351 [Triparma strigata]|uniref:Uncharacterized protein n=1 Tax=Triparma strigata TaxID=1606541 RepID=A0A9W7AXU5_9STRA|nr:hypothetical protein TrST_g10351 [Triparma strigata]
MISSLRNRLSPQKSPQKSSPKPPSAEPLKPQQFKPPPARSSMSIPNTPTTSVSSDHTEHTAETSNTVMTSDPLPQISEEEGRTLRHSSTLPPALARVLGLLREHNVDDTELYGDDSFDEDDNNNVHMLPSSTTTASHGCWETCKPTNSYSACVIS